LTTEKNEQKNDGSIAQGILIGFWLESPPLMVDKDAPEEKFSEKRQRIKEELKGFELIPGKLRIRRVNEDDRSRFRFEPPPSLNQYLIEWEHDNVEEFDQDYNLIQKTLLALQLLKPGCVLLRNMYSFHCGAKTTGLEKIILPQPPSRTWRGGYTLYLDEKENLIKIFKKLQGKDFNKDTSFRIACDRFRRSHYDQLPEDKLIDLFIGFEALFLKGSETRSKKEPLALGCSMLLGENNDGREEIKKDIKDAYILRNRIVHGSSLDKEETSDIAPKIEQYLRKSILLILE
jgi:hypothetical protein